MNSVTKPHKIGYIGFGCMAGGYHYDTAMRDDVPFAPAAVFDIDPGKRAIAESRGLRAFDNLKDFLDSKLFDLVVVATSNQFHCPYTCAALDAGYNVLCEKPAGLSSGEIEKMIDTSKKSGKLLTFHQNRRVDRDLLIVKEALEKFDIGRIFTVENRVGGGEGSTGQMFGWRRFKNHGGGLMLDWGVHVLDQTLYLINEPVKSVWAQIERIRSEETDDYSKVLIRFESGLTAQVEATSFAPMPLPKWTVIGSDGMITVKDIEGNGAGLMRIKRSHTDDTLSPYYEPDRKETRPQKMFRVDEWETVDLPVTPIPQDWAAVYKNIAGALDGKEKLIVTPESVLRCFRVIEAAVKSAEEGREIEF